MDIRIPKTQTAVQLTGPDELVLNTNKCVSMPGPYQILCRVEVVSLCFSDLKLLKQFDEHVRKSDIISGIDPDVLKEIPSYVPNKMPTVLGHETVVTVCAIGRNVKGIEINGRFLVQPDYRWLATENAGAAFGYNFEGALQQYVLMDQRAVTSPQGLSMLIPVPQGLSASAIALAEPWACIEHSYAVKERTTLKTDSQMLIVAGETVDEKLLAAFLDQYPSPAKITSVSQKPVSIGLNIGIVTEAGIPDLPTDTYDDVIYFGSDAETVESLFPKIAANGLLNIVQCAGTFTRSVVTPAGRVHYGKIRIIGTAGPDPAESMRHIPPTGQIRKGDKINVIGAAGPMGVMHVIQNICSDTEDIAVFAGDIDDRRLARLNRIARPIAQKNNVYYTAYNPANQLQAVAFDYTVIMAPVPELIAEAVTAAADNAVINIFAGIPTTVTAQIDFNAYIKKHLYFTGASGSTIRDIETVMGYIRGGKLNTDLLVGAVCGLSDAIKAIYAVENHSVSGKIAVYPDCKDLPLTTLDELHRLLPNVGECLDDGFWNKKAEDALLLCCR